MRPLDPRQMWSSWTWVSWKWSISGFLWNKNIYFSFQTQVLHSHFSSLVFYISSHSWTHVQRWKSHNIWQIPVSSLYLQNHCRSRDLHFCTISLQNYSNSVRLYEEDIWIIVFRFCHRCSVWLRSGLWMGLRY